MMQIISFSVNFECKEGCYHRCQLTNSRGDVKEVSLKKIQIMALLRFFTESETLVTVPHSIEAHFKTTAKISLPSARKILEGLYDMPLNRSYP